MSKLTKLAKRPLSKLRPEEPAPEKKVPPPAPPKTESKDLVAQRDRLLEKFTVMQSDLGGAFYEMAIRDHVRLDVLTRKAAELQRVDAELTTVERQLEVERSDAAGHCPNCGSPFGHGVRFCGECGSALSAPIQDAPAAAPSPATPESPAPEAAVPPAPAFPAAAEAPTEVNPIVPPEQPKAEAGP